MESELHCNDKCSRPFKLEAGQDRVFADAILLRLADTFRNGNNFSRFCILLVLMLEFKERGSISETFHFDGSERTNSYRRMSVEGCGSRCQAIRMSRSKDGLLTTKKIANHVEILRRIKSVMDSGDPTSRALALRVLGCLADLGKDSVDVHSLVLQAVQSPYYQEVSAAFFAIECLSEVCEEFAENALEKAYELVNSLETPPKTKVRVVRFFSKLGHFSVLAMQAHEMGRRIMLRLPTSEIVSTMLVALTRLASESVIIVKSQVELLLNYIRSDPRTRVRAIALTSLRKLMPQTAISTGMSKTMFSPVFSILQDSALPSVLHVLAIQVIRKVVRHNVLSLDLELLQQVMDWSELLAATATWPVVFQALSLLVEVAVNLRRLSPLIKHQWNTTELDDLCIRLCFLLCDQVSIGACFVPRQGQTEQYQYATRLMIESNDESPLVGSSERTYSSCTLLSKLVEGNPNMCARVVENVTVLIESLAGRLKNQGAVDENEPSMKVDGDVSFPGDVQPDIPGCKETCDYGDIEEQLVQLGRCLGGCVSVRDWRGSSFDSVEKELRLSVNTLLGTGAPLSVVGPVVEALMKAVTVNCSNNSDNVTMEENVSQSSSSRSTRKGIEKMTSGHESMITLQNAVETFTKKGSGWMSYNLGRRAAACGLWKLARLCFSNLIGKAISEGCYFWLRALFSLCTGESVLEGVEFGRDPENIWCGEEERLPSGSDAESKDYGQEGIWLYAFGSAAASSLPFLKSCLCNLSAASSFERKFDFQRWVLSLRIEMVECAAELFALVTSISSFNSDAGVIDLEDEGRGSSMKNLVSALKACTEKVEQLSSRLVNLSEEYDLMTMYFMGLDAQTEKILSEAAHVCSLLNFCALGVFSSHPTSFQSAPNAGRKVGEAALDLYNRLQPLESGDWNDLLLFSIQSGVGTREQGRFGCFVTKAQNHALLNLSKWAVDGVLDVQKHHSLLGVIRGTLLFGQIMREILSLRSICPPYFFCTRPRVGIQVFVTQAQGGSVGDTDDLSVAQGCTLSLSVCIKVVNASVDFYFHPKKLVCALTHQPWEVASRWDEGTDVGSREDFRGGYSHKVDMVEGLLSYWRLGKANSNSQRTSYQSDSLGRLEVDKCFFTVAVDTKGQGFASCTLDVSGSPPGDYALFVSGLCTDKSGRAWFLPLLSSRSRFRVLALSESGSILKP